MKKSNALMIFGVGVATLMFALGAQANGGAVVSGAGGVGDMGKAVSSGGAGVYGALTTVFVLLGFGAAAFGIWKFIQSSKPGSQETKGGAITWFIMGALLVAINMMISVGQKTVGINTSSDITNMIGK